MAKLSKPKKVVKSVAKAVKKTQVSKSQNKPAAGHRVTIYGDAVKSGCGGRKQAAKGKATKKQGGKNTAVVVKQPPANRSRSAKNGAGGGGNSAPKVVKIVKQENQVRPVVQKAPQPKTGGRGGRGGGPGNGQINAMKVPQMGSGGYVGGQSTAIQTAQLVAQNPGHAKHREVNELLLTLQKGWIDQRKFADLLQGILF